MDFELTKEYLRIELDITVDDNIVAQLISATKAHIEKRIDRKLEDVISENEGEIPADLNAWMMAHVATLYANREHISCVKTYNVRAWDSIIETYKSY